MKRQPETYEPYLCLLHCGICGTEVARWHNNDFGEVKLDAYAFEQEMMRVEVACEDHLTAEHPLRYRLWRRLRWRWLAGGLL